MGTEGRASSERRHMFILDDDEFIFGVAVQLLLLSRGFA